MSQNNERKIGRVKWFGKGYGFVIDVDDSTKEYFVHHSAIIVNDNDTNTEKRVYKKLEKGEYIEFNIEKDDQNRDCAISVTGIKKGPLMCESNFTSMNRRRRYYSRSRSRRHRRRYTSSSRSRSSNSRSRSR